MNLIETLPLILEESRNAWETAKPGSFFLREDGSGFGRKAVPAEQREKGPDGGAGEKPENGAGTLPRSGAARPSAAAGEGPGNGFGNLLALGENAGFLKYLAEEEGLKEAFQLIYIDPPFFSQADYRVRINAGPGGEKNGSSLKKKAYSDIWADGMREYLTMLTLRFRLIRDLLSETGCLWVHLDWHSVYPVKLLLDAVFGEQNFVNEIIWQYKSGGTGKRRFARKHDTLLFYSKTKNYFFEPQKEKSYNRGLSPYRFKGVKEYRDETGWHTLVNMKDVWALDMVGRTSSERTGYATQKPEALINRILSSCTRPGDLCGDFFCGSGTLAAAAEDMGRRWICCDRGELAALCTLKRMAARGAGFRLLEQAPARREGRISARLLPGSGTGGADILKLCGLEKTRLTAGLEIPRRGGDAALARKKRELESLLKQDWLSVAAYWSVDFSYDGNVHRPKRRFFRDKDGIPGQTDLPEGSAGGKISVYLLDILGNHYFGVFQTEGGNLIEIR